MDPPAKRRQPNRSDLRDLARLNRWLCFTRFRASSAVIVFTLLLRALGVGTIATESVAAVCLGLFAVSIVGLRSRTLADVPWTFFYLQSLADLAGITLGIGFSVGGQEALLFRPIYALVVVPASLISVRSGLVIAACAGLGHEMLLVADRGFSLATLCSFESLCPPFLFFLIAQQGFFYGTHLARKNDALSALAQRLRESRRRVASQARTAGALLDVARTLGETLEAPDLLARVNAITRLQSGADWSATFLVDAARATFRVMAVSDTDGFGLGVGRLEFPMRGWPPIERLAEQPIVVLDGEHAEHTPGLFASDQRVTTVILAGLYHEGVLSGFLAAGFATLSDPERDRAIDFLTGIGQHATIVLRNARLLEEVRLAGAMKSEFAGAVSHELRSPLNVMLGYLEMLLDEGLGPITIEQREALHRTRRQSLALLEMITALLDLNRLEAGRLPVDRAPVALDRLLDEICQQLPDNWRRTDVVFRVDVEPGLPVVQTDAGKLKTCIRNLLHNAFKFTARGEVRLRATLTPSGDVAVGVRDTGCGIPADALPRIFDMFHQVPGAGGGGVGLGLHLVRRLIDALGGTVDVSSEVGRGTSFVITLPLHAGTDADAPGTRAADAA
jgi:signal transduction histidine kinase